MKILTQIAYATQIACTHLPYRGSDALTHEELGASEKEMRSATCYVSQYPATCIFETIYASL
jgi:hypothetical protein